jgi:hypothetical protein
MDKVTGLSGEGRVILRQVVDAVARDPEQVQKVCLRRSLYGRPSGSKIKR